MTSRGTVLIISAGGGTASKPRPAIVIQDEQFNFAETLLIAPLTGQSVEESAVMPVIQPDEQNGLAAASGVMVHRMGAVRKSDVGREIGRLSASDMARVDVALLIVLGLYAI